MKSGELFAGVGGLTMAVDQVFNATPAWFCQHEPPTEKQKYPSQAPSKVLAFHWPDVPNYGDVTTVDWESVPRVNVMAGGFPCTDVSLAGRRAGMKDGTRSGLWSEYARAIEITRPDWVVIENVAGLFTAETDSEVEPCPWCLGDGPDEYSLRALDAVLGDLATLGFDAEWGTLRASDVGAAHGRLRVFILAWPRERTPADTGRGGSRGWAEGQEPSRGDDATLGSDPGRDGGRSDHGLRLLPTTTAMDSKASGGSSASDVTLTDAVVRTQLGAVENTRHRLLPTPEAKLAHSGPDYARMNRDGSGGDDLTTTLWREGMHLLPTPVAQPSGNTPEEHLRKKPGRQVVTDLAIIAENGLIESGGRLLPTPNVAMAEGGQTSRSGDRKGEPLLGGIAVERATDWGPYEPAIRRAEQIIGRPAPAPVRFDGKGGKPRLNPELTEWMMTWPAGHVTNPAIGISRADQLKGCGNGVVTMQAVEALNQLLTRPGVPGIDERLAA